MGLTKTLAQKARSNLKSLLIKPASQQQQLQDDQNPLQKTSGKEVCNPIKLLSTLSFIDWSNFFSIYLCFLIDFFDFGTISVESIELSNHFKTSNTVISTGLMFSMLTRVIGAILFGLAGDCFGRRWPLVINCIYVGLMQILTIYSSSIKSFLIIRAFFGIALGGVYGNGVSSVCDRAPIQTKGLITGLIWSAGDLAIFLTAGVKMALDKRQNNHWSSIFWVGAGLSFFAAFVRACVPDSPQFKRNQEDEETFLEIQENHRKLKLVKQSVSIYAKNTILMSKEHWQTFVYCSLFVFFLCFASHACVDVYPVFLQVGKGLSASQTNKAMLITNTGGFIGSILGGFLSQIVGRRRCVMIAVMVVLCLLPAYLLPTTYIGLGFGGFFYIMMTNIANGVISIHLSELSPPAYRSVLAGTAYSLASTLSSPAAYIMNAISSSHFVEKKDQNGNLHSVQAYGITIGTAAGILYFLVFILTAIGPEKHSFALDDFIPASRLINLPTSKNADNKDNNHNQISSSVQECV